MLSPDISAKTGPDFTLAGYRDLLARTISELPPRTFDLIDDPSLPSTRFCLIRHDIDMSPRLAVEIAQIEADLKVKSTYAVLLTGKFYNPLEQETRNVLLKVASLGHEIALHFDAEWHSISNTEHLEKAVLREKEILSWALGDYPIKTFSFHNTTPFTMQCRAPRYGGCLNMYAGILQDNVRYVSDSNGYWRFNSWAHVLKERPARLQVLTHPEWWTPRDATPAEKVCQHLEERSREVWDWYVELLANNNRENRSPLPLAMKILASSSTWERSILQRWLAGHHEQSYDELSRRLEDLEPQSLRAANDAPETDAPLSHHDLAQRFEQLALRWASIGRAQTDMQ